MCSNAFTTKKRCFFLIELGNDSMAEWHLFHLRQNIWCCSGAGLSDQQVYISTRYWGLHGPARSTYLLVRSFDQPSLAPAVDRSPLRLNSSKFSLSRSWELLLLSLHSANTWLSLTLGMDSATMAHIRFLSPYNWILIINMYWSPCDAT